MPADDRFRSDQDQILPPAEVESANRQPEESVSGLEVRARAGTEGDLELVAQEQVLDHQVSSPAK